MFSKNEFWKFIGCIILVVTYSKKEERLRGLKHKKYFVKAEGEIIRYVIGNKYLLKVICHLHCFNF